MLGMILNYQDKPKVKHINGNKRNRTHSSFIKFYEGLQIKFNNKFHSTTNFFW